MHHGYESWHPIPRCPSFDWEVPDVAALLGHLDSIVVKPNQEDRKVWWGSSDEVYRVRSGI